MDPIIQLIVKYGAMWNLCILFWKEFALLGFFFLALSGCERAVDIEEPIPSAANLNPEVTATILPPVAEPEEVILWAAPESDPNLLAQVQSAVQAQADTQGFQIKIEPLLTSEGLQGNVRLVVILAPAGNGMQLVAATPQVPFVALNIEGMEPSANLTLIREQEGQPEQQGFLAGYIAAMMTDQWRVGNLSISDTVSGQKARQGFLTGVPFFCGLCRQEFPPFYAYPISAEAPATATSQQWQAAADVLLNAAVETVFLGPGVTDAALMEYLAGRGVFIVGSSSPIESVRTRWLVSIQADIMQGFRNALPQLLAGEVLGEVHAPLVLSDVNPALLSEGRLAHVEEILKELELGMIATQRQ